MKLEKIVKVAVPTVIAGVVIYKLTAEYFIRGFERDLDKYLNNIREKGL